MTEILVEFQVEQSPGNRQRRKETFTKEPLHCPACGKQSVWSDSCDDYYVGCGYFCLECRSMFYLPGSVCSVDDLKSEFQKAKLDALTKMLAPANNQGGDS
jgi:hypothetical protein